MFGHSQEKGNKSALHPMFVSNGAIVFPPFLRQANKYALRRKCAMQSRLQASPWVKPTESCEDEVCPIEATFSSGTALSTHPSTRPSSHKINSARTAFWFGQWCFKWVENNFGEEISVSMQ